MNAKSQQVISSSIALSVRERMMRKQSEAAALYEARWTLRALRRVDAELCDAIEEQRSMFHEALITGEDEDIIEQGEAMCRGWAAAIRRMEQEQVAEDAGMVGFDPATGMKVVISGQRAVEQRAKELYGDTVVFLTPDEVAAMFAGLQSVAKVKALWPGAEIVRMSSRVVDRFPDEPTGD